MNYEKFREVLAEEVRRQSEGKLQVRLNTLTKNNGVAADALEMQEPGSRYVPVLYLDSFYEQYLRGVGIAHLASLILDCYEEFRRTPPLRPEQLENYEKAAPSVFCKVINYERNRRLLEAVPHERWLDLAVVYYCQLDFQGTENATLLLHNSHLKLWGISREQLQERAWANTLEQLTPLWQDLKEVLGEDDRFAPGEPEELASIYLLTNIRKCLGAICIHYPRMAEQIGEKLQSDYYVLPSSVHECLILPARGYDGRQLKEMVKEINDTRLPPQEILSDQVYYYDRNLRRLGIREA